MRAALVAIDLQQGYFKGEPEESALPELVASVNELVKAFDAKDLPVFWAGTVHKRDRSTWTRKMLETDSPFMIEGTDDVRPVPGLARTDRHIVIDKTRDSAFLRTDLEDRLRAEGCDSVVLAGVSTHECVGSTGLDAYGRDFVVIIADEATYSPKGDHARAVVNLLRDEYDQAVLDNERILERISD